MSITGWLRCFAVMMVMGLTVACTQEPAHVEYKGSEFFGKDGYQGGLDTPNHETYSTDSPRYKEGYTRPVEPAGVASVAVSDLPPPTPGGQVSAQNTPFSSPSAPLPPQATPPSKTLVATNRDRFIWPVAGGKVISHFGMKSDGKSNEGINISVAEGEPIWAAADGTVVYAGNELQSYGNMIIIRHDDGWMTAYAHARSLSVKKGDQVRQSELIGYVGVSGGVKTPQLHFAIRNGKTPVDPEQYLPQSVAVRQ